MSSLTTKTIRVAIAGATGNLGPQILKALQAANFEVTVLTREGSSSSSTIPAQSNTTIKAVDYTSVPSLTSALQGVDAVVSTLASSYLSAQINLIDASVAAGVKRFLPSEFGGDVSNPNNKALPVYAGKVATRNRLYELVKRHPEFSYTLICNNLFFDWGLDVGFILNPRQRSGVIYDGGDVPLSVTTLATVGKAVVAVLNNLELTKNQDIFIHDTAITQNRMIEIVKSLDGEKSWSLEHKDTKDILKQAHADLKKAEEQQNTEAIGQVQFQFLFPAAFSKANDVDYTARTWNERLGLPFMTEEQVKEVIQSAM